MRFRPIGAQEQSIREKGQLRVRSIAVWSLVATCALAAGGCVTEQRQPDPPASPPENRDNTNSTQSNQAPLSHARTDFHEKATSRQQFQVHIDFGRAFEAQGNLDAAILEYQDALKVIEDKRRRPFRAADEALAHRRIGGAMDRLGRFAQAETHYKQALKLSPKDAKIWNDAGYSYYLQGRWADAERTLKTAVRLAPADERIRTNLGMTLAAEGRTEEALPLLSQANGEAIGHANLGYLLAATGQTDLARRQYETALALRPDLTVARRALAQLDHKQALPKSEGPSPALAAEGTRTPAHPVDPSVNQASTAKIKIPPPLPKRMLPEARPPVVIGGQSSRAPASIPRQAACALSSRDDPLPLPSNSPH